MYHVIDGRDISLVLLVLVVAVSGSQWKLTGSLGFDSEMLRDVSARTRRGFATYHHHPSSSSSPFHYRNIISSRSSNEIIITLAVSQALWSNVFYLYVGLSVCMTKKSKGKGK